MEYKQCDSSGKQYAPLKHACAVYMRQWQTACACRHCPSPCPCARACMQIFTILVLAGDPAVEVKGAVQEVALKAGAQATWVFVPIKPGTYPLRCTVKGHDGMRGEIVIKKASASA